MSFPKVALACGLAAVTLSACGSTSKPVAGTPGVATAPGIRGKIDDPRTNNPNHLACIQAAGLSVTATTTSQGDPGLQIGAAPGGPSVTFLSTPGAAQYAQISGGAQAAEVVGAALVFPNQGSDSELKAIEDCLSHGVQG
jgi:hypothetical protein